LKQSGKSSNFFKKWKVLGVENPGSYKREAAVREEELS